MLRENRIKDYKFGAVSGAVAGFYTSHPINGTIQKITYDYNNSATGGSVWVLVSGTVAEQIHYIKGFAADTVAYPMVQRVDNANASVGYGSGNNIFTEYIVNAPLQLVLSGIGAAGSKIDGVTIYYI